MRGENRAIMRSLPSNASDAGPTRLRTALAAMLSLLLATGALLGGCETTRWEKAETVVVEMFDHRFEPNALEFRRGKPYRLEPVNRGRELHEFTAPEFFRAAAIRNPEALALGGGEVVLQPGE